MGGWMISSFTRSSMRPPHEAGEVPARPAGGTPAREIFNEAPARGGGGRDDVYGPVLVYLSSMRPPHEAGEVICGITGLRRVVKLFNEAPARGGGGLAAKDGPDADPSFFNEAPARGGGGRQRRPEIVARPASSMRPPHEAGEVLAALRRLRLP